MCCKMPPVLSGADADYTRVGTELLCEVAIHCLLTHVRRVSAVYSGLAPVP